MSGNYMSGIEAIKVAMEWLEYGYYQNRTHMEN